MALILNRLHKFNANRYSAINDFGMTEMLISLAAGGLIVVGSGAALQSM